MEICFSLTQITVLYFPTSKINCITQDQEGEMWIGTEKGIKVIYDLSSTFSSNSTTTSNVECNNIVYDEQGIAQYLLSFENITCIMVDGANRKWVGTERNGIYVLSESGDKELYHFTIENSPLFSGKIVSMAQNPITGEVFIGTDRGLISYRAESTEGAEKAGELTTYPNPIKEDYNGTIAIKGFVKDSDVRITDATGKMIAHLKSLGGQAIWDGKNFKGQRVGTGVYFIFSSANEGKDKADGKFLIIR
jgi:ligand-binding sensor domain-containing protein